MQRDANPLWLAPVSHCARGRGEYASHFPMAPTLETNSPVDGFTGHIAKAPGVALRYRAAMCAVAAVMILLPLVYVAIIAAAGWGVVFYAVHGVVIIENAHGLLALALYLGPLVAGAVLIVVMIAPLFSAPKRGPEPLFVSKEQEPLLYALVERVCREVRAPLPRRIAVTCEVNASASFERGLPALLLGRLRLTIGMPLVRGLTMEQLTGVLAHEFGHFAQGGGMRLSYIIRSINAWFARVIYERSELERGVAKMGRSGVGVLALVALICELLMRGARWILRALMRFGGVISAYLLRQMEFDADAHMARVVGGETLVATMTRLPELNAGARRAWELVNEFVRINKLPADVNVLIADMGARLPGSTRARLAQELNSNAHGRFDTHPTSAARIAAARRLAEPGIFHNDANAATLFTNADALGREATRHHYAILAGVDMSKITLIENTEASRRDETRMDEQNAADTLFEDLPLTALKLSLDDPATAAARADSADNPPEAIAQKLQAARAALVAAVAEARPAIVRYDRAQESWRAQLTANVLFDAGFVAAARQIQGASVASLKKTIDTINELERRAAELNAATESLQPCAAAVSAFINAAATRRIQETTAIQDAAAQTKARDNACNRLKILAMLCACAPDTRKMEETALAMPVLIRALSAQGEVTRDQLNMATLTTNLGIDAGNRCADALGKIPSPFEEMPEGSTMSAYLLTGNDPSAHKLVNNTRLVGHLHARMGEAAQRIAGWFAATKDHFDTT